MKKILIILGFVSLILGIIGAFLPILPTTPFVLLSAWLFARSSEKFHRKLLNHKIFGKLIRDFQEDKSIPLHTKIISVSMMWASMIFAILVPANGKVWLQILLGVIAIGVTIHILSYKTRK
jgi:uncharacterized protein